MIKNPLFGLDASFAGNFLFRDDGDFTFANDERILCLIVIDFVLFEQASCVGI